MSFWGWLFGRKATAVPVQTEDPPSHIVAFHNDGEKFTVEYDEVVGFDSGETITLFKTGPLWEQIFNSQNFMDFVIGFSFNGNKNFQSTNDTNEQVYATLMGAKQGVESVADNTANVRINLDPNNAGRVIGYTYPGDPRQYVYKSYFDSATLDDILDNEVHEYCHQVGYTHSYFNNATRQFSVPYAVGYWVGDTASKMIAGTLTLTPLTKGN